MTAALQDGTANAYPQTLDSPINQALVALAVTVFIADIVTLLHMVFVSAAQPRSIWSFIQYALVFVELAIGLSATFFTPASSVIAATALDRTSQVMLYMLVLASILAQIELLAFLSPSQYTKLLIVELIWAAAAFAFAIDAAVSMVDAVSAVTIAWTSLVVFWNMGFVLLMSIRLLAHRRSRVLSARSDRLNRTAGNLNRIVDATYGGRTPDATQSTHIKSLPLAIAVLVISPFILAVIALFAWCRITFAYNSSDRRWLFASDVLYSLFVLLLAPLSSAIPHMKPMASRRPAQHLRNVLPDGQGRRNRQGRRGNSSQPQRYLATDSSRTAVLVSTDTQMPSGPSSAQHTGPSVQAQNPGDEFQINAAQPTLSSWSNIWPAFVANFLPAFNHPAQHSFANVDSGIALSRAATAIVAPTATTTAAATATATAEQTQADLEIGQDVSDEIGISSDTEHPQHHQIETLDLTI